MSSDRLPIRRDARVLSVMVMLLGLGACAETQFLITAAKKARDDGTQQGAYKVGKPYQINGVWYYPAENYEYDETGIASWYGPQFHGKLTANGEVYDMNDVTAAHRTLPMPSIVRVVNLDNGRSLVVRVNDRGPYARGRIIDLSRRSAQLLGFEGKGTARVRVQVMADESRVIAARAQGNKGVVRPDASLTVDRLPKASVSSQSIPPPGGAKAAPAPKAPETEIASAEPAAPTPPVTSSKVGQITQGAPVATRIYVQAGAFGQYDNANRVRAKLTGVGPTQISSVLVNGRDLFRVRVGPLANVAEADHLLDSVIRSGYPEARVIVD